MRVILTNTPVVREFIELHRTIVDWRPLGRDCRALPSSGNLRDPKTKSAPQLLLYMTLNTIKDCAIPYATSGIGIDEYFEQMLRELT